MQNSYIKNSRHLNTNANRAIYHDFEVNLSSFTELLWIITVLLINIDYHDKHFA